MNQINLTFLKYKAELDLNLNSSSEFLKTGHILSQLDETEGKTKVCIYKCCTQLLTPFSWRKKKNNLNWNINGLSFKTSELIFTKYVISTFN
jgi:hypothetical protein